jgi:hypothetical protein
LASHDLEANLMRFVARSVLFFLGVVVLLCAASSDFRRGFVGGFMETAKGEEALVAITGAVLLLLLFFFASRPKRRAKREE